MVEQRGVLAEMEGPTGRGGGELRRWVDWWVQPEITHHAGVAIKVVAGPAVHTCTKYTAAAKSAGEHAEEGAVGPLAGPNDSLTLRELPTALRLCVCEAPRGSLPIVSCC